VTASIRGLAWSQRRHFVTSELLAWGLPWALLSTGVGFACEIETIVGLGGPLFLLAAVARGLFRPTRALDLALILDRVMNSNEAVLNAIELRETLKTSRKSAEEKKEWTEYFTRTAANFLSSRDWSPARKWQWPNRRRDLRRLAWTFSFAAAASGLRHLDGQFDADSQAHRSTLSSRKTASERNTPVQQKPGAQVSPEDVARVQELARAIASDSETSVSEFAHSELARFVQMQADRIESDPQALANLAGAIAQSARELEESVSQRDLEDIELQAAWRELNENLRRHGFDELATQLRQGNDLALAAALDAKNTESSRRLRAAFNESLTQSLANLAKSGETSQPDGESTRRLKKPASPQNPASTAATAKDQARDKLEKLRRLGDPKVNRDRQKSTSSATQREKEQQEATQSLRDLKNGAQRAEARQRLRRSLSTATQTLRRIAQKSAAAGAAKNGDKDARERFSDAAAGRPANDQKSGKSGKDRGDEGSQAGDESSLAQHDPHSNDLLIADGGDNPGDGNHESGSDGEASEGKNPATESQSGMGEGAGRGEGPRFADNASFQRHRKQAQSLKGREGSGPSRSTVIESASLFGFDASTYADVFADYSSYAQSSMDRDAVSPEVRDQVFRYFQLIRPRP
jgi:hypothetical protein